VGIGYYHDRHINRPGSAGNLGGAPLPYGTDLRRTLCLKHQPLPALKIFSVWHVAVCHACFMTMQILAPGQKALTGITRWTWHGSSFASALRSILRTAACAPP